MYLCSAKFNFEAAFSMCSLLAFGASRREVNVKSTASDCTQRRHEAAPILTYVPLVITTCPRLARR